MCTSHVHDSCVYLLQSVCVHHAYMVAVLALPVCYTVQTVQEETCGLVVKCTTVEPLLRTL